MSKRGSDCFPNEWQFMIKFKQSILIFSVTVAAYAGMSISTEAAVEAALGSGTASEMFSANYGSSCSALTSGDSENLALADFDPSLGILTGVTLTLISRDTVESEVIDLTGQNEAYSDATATLPVSISGPGGLAVTATSVAGPFSGVATSPKYNTEVAGSSRVITTTSAEVAPGDFILYEGAGQTFDVSVLVSDGVYSGSSTGNSVAFFGAGASCGTVDVTYDYVAVPEPGTLAAGLGLLGYCGMIVVRRIHAWSIFRNGWTIIAVQGRGFRGSLRF